MTPPKNYTAPTLETVDLEDVDIMAAGARVHGAGSPPEGDVYERDELERIAEDSNKVVDLRKPVNKIGHSFDQRLASTVGLTPGEMPALGWLRNFRVHDDNDGRPKLYADIVKVPKKFADLVKAGAFRTRSAEIGAFRAQEDGGTREYGAVIKGLAWHGAQPSAFQTLDDIYALFEEPETYERAYKEDEIETSVRELAGTTAVVEVLQRIFREELPPAANPDDTYDQMGEMNLTPEQADKLRKSLGLGDDATIDKVFEAVDEVTKPVEGVTLTLTDEQAATLRTQLGLDEDAPVEKIFAAVEARTKAVDPNTVTISKEQLDRLEKKADRGDRAFEDARVSERDRYFLDAVKVGKIEPSAVEELKKSYDENESWTRRTIDALPENPEWARVYGSDESGVDAQGEDDYYKAFAALDGGPAPSLQGA
jgi:hypothetical protein